MDEKRCDKCVYSEKMQDLLLCKRYPPTMTAFGQTSFAPGKQDFQTFFNFPIVRPEWKCGEYGEAL